jgi:CubicO group peptidase (beta-lactamase class C family)
MSRQTKRRAKRKKKIHKVLLGIDILVIIGGLIGIYYLFLPTEPTAASSSPSEQVTHSSTTSNASSQKEQPANKKQDLLDAGNYDNLSKDQEVVTAEGTSYDQKILSSGFIGSALIVKNGKILLHKGYGYADKAADIKNTPTTLFNIGSIQKGLTAVLVMRAINERKLSLADKLARFYPNIPDAANITIQQMLQMASGLKLTENPKGLENVPQILNWYATHTVSSGTKGSFKYSPVNYNLLAGILTKVTGENYDTLFNNFFIKKHDLKQTLLYRGFLQQKHPTIDYKPKDNENPYSVPNKLPTSDLASEIGTGNLYMSVGDLYRYYDLLLKGKLLDKASLKQMWQPAAGGTYAAGIYDKETYFRAHGVKGGYESFGLFSKDNKTSVILLSNHRHKSDTELLNQLYRSLANVDASF